MGVYIPDMKMPSSCLMCDIPVRVQPCPVDHDNVSNYKTSRHPACPLLPVPEHGRLGDLDALVDWLKLSYGTSIPIVRGLLFSSIIKEIQEYPSVIPAEQKSKEEGEAK